MVALQLCCTSCWRRQAGAAIVQLWAGAADACKRDAALANPEHADALKSTCSIQHTHGAACSAVRNHFISCCRLLPRSMQLMQRPRVNDLRQDLCIAASCRCALENLAGTEASARLG